MHGGFSAFILFFARLPNVVSKRNNHRELDDKLKGKTIQINKVNSVEKQRCRCATPLSNHGSETTSSLWGTMNLPTNPMAIAVTGNEPSAIV